MSINSLLDIAAFSPRWLQFQRSSIGHLPFAAWLIREVSPKVFVELDTNSGNFYFTFCQSVIEAGLSTKCFAIDSWQGGEKTWEFSEQIFASQKKVHNEEHYAGFSQLLQMSFGDAAPHFTDKSIELLHIDGLHTYEAIVRTFEAWLPKLAPNAVLMFHNTNVHEPNFGVWKLWEELQTCYPNNLKFVHSNGLGVLQLNDAPTDKIMAWLEPNATEKQRLISYFAVLGSQLLERYDLALFKNQLIERDKQITSLSEALTERNLAKAESDQVLAEREEKILALSKIVTKLDKELHHIVQSKSWEFTKPVRIIRRILESGEFDFSDGYTVPDYRDDLLSGVQFAVSDENNAESEYLALFKAKPLNDKPVKLIYFYQKQECNELSNKDLNDMDELCRHIELAKLYGIEGFCFCYDVNNRQLPQCIKNLLNDVSLDLPFCLRLTGTGQESNKDDYPNKQLLGDQLLSLEESMDFIQRISNYLRDTRYIRIGNRPLVIVDCPRFLETAKKISERWRLWCFENGVGEIYLACIASTEKIDPAVYGFDAVVEFSINTFINETDLAKNHGPEYSFFLGVCPQPESTLKCENEADNTQRLILLSYQSCLFRAISDTAKRIGTPEERFIFIDKGNCLLSPHPEVDERYDFAYLEATRMALVRACVIDDNQSQHADDTIAVVIHAFYEDILDEIFEYLANIQTIPFKLYVTTPVKLFKHIERKLQRKQQDFYILPVSNRGRDVLPFLKILPEVVKGKHEFLIKVHTKKSMHRDDGDLWRRDVFDKLLMESALKINIDYLTHDHQVGILGPTEHIVPLDRYMGKNKTRVVNLSARLGVDYKTMETLSFVAGTMFMARTRALIPLMNLALSETDFEAEVKQNDGTLAHALERVFPVSAMAVGLNTTCIDNIITENYKFVNKAELD